MIEGYTKKVTSQEMATALKAIKLGTEARPSEMCAEMMSASGKVGLV